MKLARKVIDLFESRASTKLRFKDGPTADKAFDVLDSAGVHVAWADGDIVSVVDSHLSKAKKVLDKAKIEYMERI